MPASLAAKYGLSVDDGPTSMHTELTHANRGGIDDQLASRFWHPDSPLFWLAVLGAATVGLAAVSGSGSVRVGPLHASAAAGAGK